MAESKETVWRATGAYLASSALMPGMLLETRQFLLTYATTSGSPIERLAQTRQILIERELHQRSHASRYTIVDRIQKRLVRWQPPQWVLDDLIAYARQDSQDALKAALLLHICRQDLLLYDLVQNVILPRWINGERGVAPADVQRFLDQATPLHPEVSEWTHGTRAKLASNVLSTLRDYGLLQGQVRKTIIEPIVPDLVVAHLVRLLTAEGFSREEISKHPDWQIWLWQPVRIQQAYKELEKRFPDDH